MAKAEHPFCILLILLLFILYVPAGGLLRHVHDLVESPSARGASPGIVIRSMTSGEHGNALPTDPRGGFRVRPSF